MTLLFEGEPLAERRQVRVCDALPPPPGASGEAALARRVVAGPGAMLLPAGRALSVPRRVEPPRGLASA